MTQKKNSSRNSAAAKPSAFSRLHQRQSQKAQRSERTSALLMSLSASDHKAIAQVISRWLSEKPD
ncbi:hypothetical protein QTP81_08290 [Alteromonas sp. ASW11-36]|uniref:Uncharacterized protein n=1 Tax=Alteromonas arenosi TaxID=3055817 RepID=A0ABT7SWM3_9ALTE|nr:hypothetical protein [Alteromonas sp. ASW11-36]MDM7860592.1 hypothetical protein [Alteromonas sp. ASW11-36]